MINCTTSEKTRSIEAGGAGLVPFPWNLRGCFLTDSVALGEGWNARAKTSSRDLSFAPALLDEMFFGGGESAPLATPSPPSALAALAAAAPMATRMSRPAPRQERRASDPAGLPRNGSIIDKYRIERLLGTGAFAAVYLVNHMLLNVPFAMKLMLPQVVKTNPGFAEMLCEEASFTAKINHPNVVRVFDVTHSGPLAYIVMEYVDGMTLGAMLARQRLNPRDILRVGRDVCLGLQAGLEKGLIHRDIKPANLLVNTSGETKIGDLGLARLCTPPDPAAAAAGEKKSGSASTSCAGTPAYMAPEQITDPDRADFRSDIYSLGVTLFHAATGRLPFCNPVFLELVQQHVSEPPPAVQSVVPDFPQRLNDLLMRMMAKKAEQRFASYAELFQEMKSISDQLDEEDGPNGRRSNSIFGKLKKWFL